MPRKGPPRALSSAKFKLIKLSRGWRGPVVSSSDSTSSSTSSHSSNNRGRRSSNNSTVTIHKPWWVAKEGISCFSLETCSCRPCGSSSSSRQHQQQQQQQGKMLPFGASLEEASSAKETVLHVKVAQLIFTEEALPLIDNKKKLSIAVIYKGEDLAQACGDQRRVCFKVFRKKIDDTTVTLNLGHVFQLPFSSTFPMRTPSIEIYVMLESLSNLRKCVAGAKVSLGRRCRGVGQLMAMREYALFIGTNSTEKAGAIRMSLKLDTASSKAKGFLFYWHHDLRQGDTFSKPDRQICGSPSFVAFFLLTCNCTQPISGDTVLDLKRLTSRIDRLLVQMERDGVVVVPMITRLKSGDCSANRFTSFFLDSHPYRILTTTPIPLFSAKTVVKAMNGSINERTSEHGFLGWDRCATNTSDYLLDCATLVDPLNVASSESTLAATASLHKCVLTTCQAVCCASTFAFHAVQYAMQIVEEEVLRPTVECLLLGSLPFASAAEQQQGESAPPAYSPAREVSASETPEEGPQLAPVRPLYLEETRRVLDKWRDGYYFRRLPSGHRLSIFSLFKNDQLFVSRHMVGRPRSGVLLAILVLGDDEVDVEEASKLYGLEIQAQQMFNNAIVALKSQTARSSSVSTNCHPHNRMQACIIALETDLKYLPVDYKGFRVVVLPLPESVPEVLAWPQPLSSRIRQEISFLETKLNVCNLLQPVSPHDPPKGKTILLSLKSRGADTMMLYRTCYTLPLFSGIESGKASPGLAQRLRTIPFEFSADVELALKNNKHEQSHAAPSGVGNAYKDPIVRSPFSRLYSPSDELIYFLTNNYQRKYIDNVEPIVCGRVPPGRKTRRLGTIMKSVIVHEVVAELERMEPYGPYDSISLTTHLHRRGINMRLLGAMYRSSRSQWLQHMLLIEIVARTLKQLLKTVIRRLVFCTNSELQIREAAKASGKSAEKEAQRTANHQVSVITGLGMFITQNQGVLRFWFCSEGQVLYTKESLLREGFLQLPLFVSSRLLDDSPYLLDFTRHRFRTFSWPDLIALNVFNVTLGTCFESEEFWRGFLCHLCSKLYDIEASMVRKHRVYLPALYVSLQHHCGIGFFPCTATIGGMLDRAFPLMPSHIRTWTPKVLRSLVVPSALPVVALIKDPSRLPLICPSSSTIIQTPSPAQIVLSRLIGHTIFQCSSPLWQAGKEVTRGLDARVLSSIYSTTQGHPLLIAQDTWDAEEATVELIGVALRYEAWDVGQLLARRCISQFPEAHAASVPARLLLLLAATHGSAEPPPKAELAAMAHTIQRVVDYHWGGHHPAALDVTVARAWISYLGRDWAECVSGLHAAVSSSTVLSVSLTHEDLSSLKTLLAVTATDELAKVPAGIPPAPVTLKTAGLLRMLAHCKLMLVFGKRRALRRDFMARDQRAGIANSASLMLQWALDAYDFHFGARHELTLSAAREFALSLLLLIEITREDAGGSILQRGIEIAFQTLEWQTHSLGKCHLETLATGQLLAILLANQGRYRRCVDLYEALIRNAFTRQVLTHKPSLRRYRPDNEFSRVCWCLPDPYFYGIFESVGPRNRFFSKVKLTLPNLDSEQALVALYHRQTSEALRKPHFELACSGEERTPEPAQDKVFADKQDESPANGTTHDSKKTNMIQLDPSDHPIFPTMQSKAASDVMSPSIPALVGDMFVVYINFAIERKLISRLVSLFLWLDYLEKQSFKAVSYDVFEAAWSKGGGDLTSQSFFTWLLDLSGTSDLQVMEYIQHYPFRIPKEDLFDQDSHVIFLLCHPQTANQEGASRTCVMDHYLRHLLSRSEAAVSRVCQLILAGDTKKITEMAQSYSSPLEKMKRAVSKLKVVFLMLGRRTVRVSVSPRCRQPTDHGSLNAKGEEGVQMGGSFFEQLVENTEESQSQTTMRVSMQACTVASNCQSSALAFSQQRYRHFLAHVRTTLRLPTNLRCEELDILANLMYYYLDVNTFRSWWQQRYREGGGPCSRGLSSKQNSPEQYPPPTAFEEL
ncbi:hypothetical protein Esti_001333 [Eimeria stiedai]